MIGKKCSYIEREEALEYVFGYALHNDYSDGKALGTSYREPKVAYYNLCDGTFANITAEAGSVLSEPHSGVAWGSPICLTMVTRRLW